MLASGCVLDLAIAEACVIAPGSVEQLVAAKAEGGEPCVTFVVEKTVAEFGQARSRSAGDDLVKGVKGIERAGSHSGVGITGPAERGRSRRIRHPWRDGDRDKPGALEIARRRWRQFIVRLHVLIHRVGVDDQRVAEELVIHRDISAVALRIRK